MTVTHQLALIFVLECELLHNVRVDNLLQPLLDLLPEPFRLFYPCADFITLILDSLVSVDQVIQSLFSFLRFVLILYKFVI